MAENTVPTTQNGEQQAVANTREDERFLVPPVDIYETEEGLTVVADLPGVDKDNLDVRVDDGTLTIEGRVTVAARQDAVRNEFELRHYHRQFRLGEKVDQEKIAAQLQHGVLTLKLPKVEEAKPRKIDVSVA